MSVLVLGGGNSPEREVSLRSAAYITQAAITAGFDVSQADPSNGLGFLDQIDPKTVILPILHGKGGEDGVIQTELERRKLPYLGSGSQAASNCFDKWKTRLVAKEHGIPVPDGLLATKETYRGNPIAKKLHVLKVVHGGSSLGVMIVRDPQNINQNELDEVFKLENQAIVERLVEGVEVTVPVLDQTALSPIEIIPPAGGEFDYVNKYNGRTQELCPPKTISSQKQDELRQLAEKVHKTMNCRHLSRVDFMLDREGRPFMLEVNVIPGLTDQSLFPKAAAVAGLSMPDLVSFFIAMVKRDYKL
ncbi:MAG: D-alanine--D-alanine ligase [Candidatus Saccharimonadales bacterium]